MKLKAAGNPETIRLTDEQKARAFNLSDASGFVAETGRPHWAAGIRALLSGYYDFTLNARGRRALGLPALPGESVPAEPAAAVAAVHRGCPAERDLELQETPAQFSERVALRELFADARRKLESLSPP